MSERALWKQNSAYSFTIVVFDSSNNPVMGLLNTAFTKKLALNDVNSAVAVTVTEIDSVNLPGWYKVTYTPNANGHWCCVVSHATYNVRGWQDEIQVYTRELEDLAWPATTGRSILVNTDGSVAPDWANVKSPTTVLDLSGTTIKGLDTAVTVTGTPDVNVKTWLTAAPNALIGGRVDCLPAGWLTGSINDISPSATSFKTTINHDMEASVLVFTSGSLSGLWGILTGYNSGTQKHAFLGFTTANGTPSNGDSFVVSPCGLEFGSTIYPLVDLQRWAGGTPGALIAGNVPAAPDWGHVQNPATNVTLSGTTVNSTNAVGNVLGNVQGKILGGGSSAFSAVGVQIDKTGYSLTTAEENAIADAVLKRDVSNVEPAGQHTIAGVVQKIAVKAALSSDGTLLTVYRSDGTTVSYTQTTITNPNANPVTSVG